MAETPCAIVVVTATVSGHLSKVYQALGYGALDAADTPRLGPRGDVKGAEALVRKIDLVAKLLGKPVAASEVAGAKGFDAGPSAHTATPAPHPRTGPPPSARGRLWEAVGKELGDIDREREVLADVGALVLLGASTGGPHALARILAGLRDTLGRDPRIAVVVVQHLDSSFAAGVGNWLCEQAGRPVQLIADGDRPEPGTILLSGTDDHLRLDPDGRMRYTDEPRSVPYRPSIDVFFSSVAEFWPRPGVAALLTGMGRDGAEGLRQLRRRGWRTIAQDEATSVVWGMPRAAAEIGAADLVLPLPRIAETIAGWARSR
jgi:two-component system response regulator WspF